MATSNTNDVFREAIGRRIVGIYTDTASLAGDLHRHMVLVLDDGTGLGFSLTNGAHWTVPVSDVQRQVGSRRKELEALERDLRDVMATEGALKDG